MSVTDHPSENARRGRRPGSSRSREDILRAARELFGERGVGGTSIRAVAERAGVNTSVVMHFFHSKSGLLEAAIDWPFDLAAARSAIMAGSLEEVGELLVRRFVTIWDEAGAAHPILLLLRVAGSDETAARHLQALLEERLLGPLWPALVHRYGSIAVMENTAARGALLASQLLGLATTRYILRLDGVASMTPAELGKVLGPEIGRLISGDLPRA